MAVALLAEGERPRCQEWDAENQTGCPPGKVCTEASCPYIAFFCRDCQLYERCGYKGLPKILPSNASAINEYWFAKRFPGYIPQPLTQKLKTKLLLIDAELEQISREKEKQNARSIER